MGLLILEALLALVLFVFIVGWTMWPKRGDMGGAKGPGRGTGGKGGEEDGR